MSDFTEQDLSTTFPPVSSLDTPIASANLPEVEPFMEFGDFDYYDLDEDLDDDLDFEATSEDDKPEGGHPKAPISLDKLNRNTEMTWVNSN
jgi:hypothetical protein